MTVVEIYVLASEASAGGLNSKDTVVPASERKIVFAGLHALLDFHNGTFLPKLVLAAKAIFDGVPDDDGEMSRRCAMDVGAVFKSFNPFMRMYSTYIK